MNRRPRTFLTAAAAVAALALSAGPALAARTPHLKSARCYSACLSSRTVMAGGKVEVRGKRLRRKMRVVFPAIVNGEAAGRGASARLTRKGTLIARVPRNAVSGRLYARTREGAHTNSVKVRVARGAQSGHASVPGSSAFDGNGMWIWYVSKSSGGDPDAMIAQARAHRIDTVFIKSSDGSTWWSQFSPSLISALKAGGLQVCAWQYVYGDNPTAEAALGARAAQAGADCLVIDAESQYEGKYSAARAYVRNLRDAVGAGYPVGLAGFPYVDYHPSFPYSVFLGPSGAQFNLPQVYWKDIGTSVKTAMAHTFLWNLPYGRPIYPLGQLYQNPSSSDIVRFRQLAAAYGASGVSWWDWQEATAKGWNAVGADIEQWPGEPPAREMALLVRGSKGDLVLWAQEHLQAAGQGGSADGKFGSGTEARVEAFQANAGLPVTGQIDTATWDALLAYTPAPPARSKSQVTTAAAPRRAEIESPAARK